MYIPSAFAESRLSVLHDFIRRHAFATIVTAGSEGPVASHVPVVLLPERGTHGTLQFHLAKQNAHWKNLAAGNTALAVFQGPHGYVSPNWYKTPVAVPTWNYVAVHAYGVSRMLVDAELDEHLRLLVASNEPAGLGEWTLDGLPTEYATHMKRSIVGFEIEITRIEGKWKLGQNRSINDVRGVIRGLRANGDADSAALADVIETVATEMTQPGRAI